MARTYTRTVSTSAAPSRANWDPDQPRDCAGCGRKLRITRDRIFFRRYPVPASFCDACKPRCRCIYCAAKTRGSMTCAAHRDLLRLDAA